MKDVVELNVTAHRLYGLSWEEEKLRRSVSDYIAQKGVERYCDVAVKKNGQWFEFSGQVDSHWTRAVLFSLVPAKGGRRYVVDKLRVHGAFSSREIVS